MLTQAIATTMAALPEAAATRVNEIELAVAEALNNAVIHGNSEQVDAPISLWMCLEADTLEIGVADPQKKLTATMLDTAVMPEQAATDGRGLALIKTLCPDAAVTDRGEMILRWRVSAS